MVTTRQKLKKHKIWGRKEAIRNQTGVVVKETSTRNVRWRENICDCNGSTCVTWRIQRQFKEMRLACTRLDICRYE